MRIDSVRGRQRYGSFPVTGDDLTDVATTRENQQFLLKNKIVSR